MYYAVKIKDINGTMEKSLAVIKGVRTMKGAKVKAIQLLGDVCSPRECIELYAETGELIETKNYYGWHKEY